MNHLTERQRHAISCLLQTGRPQTFIASAIGKDKSVVSHEIRRNADTRNGEYVSDLAQRKYEKRQQEKPKKIRFTEPVCTCVEDKLRQKYSPEQIAGEARRLSIDCVSEKKLKGKETSKLSQAAIETVKRMGTPFENHYFGQRKRIW